MSCGGSGSSSSHRGCTQACPLEPVLHRGGSPHSCTREYPRNSHAHDGRWSTGEDDNGSDWEDAWEMNIRGRATILPNAVHDGGPGRPNTPEPVERQVPEGGV